MKREKEKQRLPVFIWLVGCLVDGGKGPRHHSVSIYYYYYHHISLGSLVVV